MAPTPPTTPNHDLPLIPHVGDNAAPDYSDEWGAILNDSGWSVLEEQLIVRDTESNRSSYTPHQDALFFATDTGAIYVGDGSSWTQTAGDVTALTVSGDVDVGGNISASNDSVSVAGNVVSLGGSTAVSHSDLSGVSTDDHHAYPVPNTGLVNDTVTVAGNSVSLGGTTALSHSDLSTVSADDHHAYPVPNSGLVNDTVTVAGNPVSLGSNTSIAHGDISSTSSSDHHAYPVPNTGLSNDSVTVAGNAVSLGGSTTIAHSDLTSTSASDHHSYPVPNSGLANSTITIAGNGVGLGGSTSIAHADLSATSSDDHHGYPVPNSGLSNDSVTVAGNTVSLGGTTTLGHSDLSGVGANDHHTAHEHPGDRAATSDINVNSNNVVGVNELQGQYATHSFTGSTYNIDLRDSSVDARFRSTAGNTIAWFRESGDVDVPNGQLSEQNNRVATRTWVDGEISAGASSLSGLDTAVSTLQSNKLDSSAYTPESDTHAKTTSASDLTDVSADSVSNAHHSRYADSEAVGAVDAQIDNAASSVSALDDAVAGKLDSADYNPESDTHSKTTSASALSDVSPDSTSDAHHTRYSDGEARSAVESGNVNHVAFANIENVSDGEIGRDNSVGFLASWGGNGTAVLWDAYNVQTDSDITVSGGTGGESQPTIGLSNNAVSVAGNSVALGGSTNIAHGDLTNISSSDHHTRYADSEAVSAVESTNIDFGTNRIQFQPGSSGGTVEGIRFDSNTNSGSDYASIRYHDSYYSDSESGVLQLQVENDELGSAGPDAVALSAVGGTFVDAGGLYLDGVDLSASDADSVTQTIWDDSAGHITQASLENDTVSVEGNSVALGGSTSVNHNDLSSISSNDHHSKTTSASDLTDVSADSVSDAHHSRYSDSEARSAVDSDVDNAASSVSALDDAVAGKLDSANYNPESDTHSKTTSASELTDVSPDSDSDAHHSRYDDGEARSAVDGANVSVDGSAGSVQTANFEVVENSSTNSLEFNYTG